MVLHIQPTGQVKCRKLWSQHVLRSKGGGSTEYQEGVPNVLSTQCTVDVSSDDAAVMLFTLSR